MLPPVPRRFVVATITCLAAFLTAVIAPVQAGATTVPWSQMTISQREVAMVSAMTTMLNSERAANHLAALTVAPALLKSAGAHNGVMAKDNLMDHQCPGEASPGTRITNAGYRWRSWGENIGWSSDETIAGVQNMEAVMYAEKAPDNGHRLNILGSFKSVGIAVTFDAVHHVFWYTQDFGTPL